MALDTEAKRWSMLQVANGPAVYSHVINPSGSDLDTEVERVTLLKLYGGLTVGDATAPVLSLATGIKTGSTTGSGTVSTANDDNGTLYFWATTNSSETAADIVANGDSQAVTATGVQNVTFTGLTAGTDYYAHYVHDDAATNRSNVESSTPAFTTDEAAEEEESNSGGYSLWIAYEQEMLRREDERKRRAKEKKKAQKIKDKLDKELALAERALEEEDARKAELARLNRLVAQQKSAIIALQDERLTYIMTEALERQTFSAIERLERSLAKMHKEDIEFLLLATQILVNQ